MNCSVSYNDCYPSMGVGVCGCDDGEQICMDHLLNVMRKADERESGFHALAEMASAVGKELKEYLPIIMSILKDAVRILFCCHFVSIY